MNGQLLAGTTRGVFVIVDDTGSTQTLEAHGTYRDLVNFDGRVLRWARPDGLFTSDDGGRTCGLGLSSRGRDVWQIRVSQ